MSRMRYRLRRSHLAALLAVLGSVLLWTACATAQKAPDAIKLRSGDIILVMLGAIFLLQQVVNLIGG